MTASRLQFEWIYLRAELMMIKTKQFEEKPKYPMFCYSTFFDANMAKRLVIIASKTSRNCVKKNTDAALADGAKAVLNLTVIMARI